MSVSLVYTSVKPVSPAVHEQLMSLVAEANAAYAWWCEPIAISPTPNANGIVSGGTTLFRDIADEVTDTYMAFLDGDEIIRFLTMVANRLEIDWRLEFEGMPVGGITKTGPDDELKAHTKMVIDLFPGDFDELKTKSRAEILAEWAGR